jgi:hypothetical protein
LVCRFVPQDLVKLAVDKATLEEEHHQREPSSATLEQQQLQEQQVAHTDTKPNPLLAALARRWPIKPR